VKVQVVARFDSPNAHAASREWRERHGSTLAEIPADAVRIDTGRAADGGDFVQISVEDEYAQRFAAD
jgi:hypothetical protein